MMLGFMSPARTAGRSHLYDTMHVPSSIQILKVTMVTENMLGMQVGGHKI